MSLSSAEGISKEVQCLEDRGMLIGTIFTTNDHPILRELSEQLGAHYYENGKEFAIQLLQHSGFKILDLEARPEGGFRFRAEKISDASLAV